MQDVLTGEVFLQLLTISIGKLAVSVRNMAKEKNNMVARAFIRLLNIKNKQNEGLKYGDIVMNGFKR